MDNIKKNFFCAIIIAFTVHPCWAWPEWLRWPKPVGTAAVEKVDEVLNHQIPALKEFTDLAGDKVVETSKVLLSDAASQLGLKSVEKLAAVGDKAVVAAGVIAGAVVVVHSVTQLYPIGKEIVNHACPSEKQKIQQEEDLKNAKKRIRTLDLEEQLGDCLVNNKMTQNWGASGLPQACESLADALAYAGKYQEVQQATAYISKYRK